MTADKPELLAPAGTLNSAIAAIQSGADAVYAGISRFNAREMGENFSWDDMSRLSAYTKKNNRLFYLTLNTIIKENELEDFGDSVERISRLKPDAVIVQDIGVVRFLREYFPKLTIHGSTQMGIHNSAGVKTAAAMGMERVILERQVGIDELKKICASKTEIEVFIHGALCCSISGHCLFSSWLGGWSGNRGRCKQPCRRRFHGEEDGKRKSGFFFSTSDYYSLDMLDVLADAGVRSLKIEGRLKKPDYVKSVVTAYRMMLDSPPEDRGKTLKEARAILAGSYGRKWSHGFSTPEDLKSLIQYDSIGVSGRLIGSVEKSSKNGFEASISQRLHIGDRIRIQPRSGDEGPSITVTKLSTDRQNIKTASRGSRVFIHCDKPVKPGSMIYKIGESSAEAVKQPSDLPLYDPPIEIGINIKASAEGIEVTADLPGGRILKWSDDEPIEPASNRPLEAETLVDAFSATRNPGLTASPLTAETAEGLFLPAGRLKKLRRAFWEWLETQDDVIDAIEKSAEGESGNWRQQLNADLKNFRLEGEKIKTSPALPSVFLPGGSASQKPPAMTAILKAEGVTKKRLNTIDIISFINSGTDSNKITATDNNSKANSQNGETEIILPFFCPENRLKDLADMIKTAVERGIKHFRLTSLYQFELLKRAGIPAGTAISTSFPLPAANSLAARELQSLGAERAQIWLELDRESIEAAAANWPIRAEIYRRGKPFLLATRASISIDGTINDSRGKEFYVENPPVNDLDFSAGGRGNKTETGALGFVFPSEVIVLPAVKGCADYYELNRTAGREKETGFNYDFTLI